MNDIPKPPESVPVWWLVKGCAAPEPEWRGQAAGNVARWLDLEAAKMEEALEATLAAGREVAGMGLEL